MVKGVRVTDRRTGAKAGLSRERVLDGALEYLDAYGLPALSMRKLGTHLGVEAMSLYRHVPNKGALLDGLVDRVMQLAFAGLRDRRRPARRLGAVDAAVRARPPRRAAAPTPGCCPSRRPGR